MPKRVPITEAIRDMVMACAPFPAMASGKPSSVAAALAGVPGMPIRTPESEPPETPPTYSPMSKGDGRMPRELEGDAGQQGDPHGCG